MVNRKRAQANREAVRKTVKTAVTGVRKAGSRVAKVLAETPEYIYLQRNDHAIRREMREHMRSIGKRAMTLHKRARRESPFAKFPAIMKELERLADLEQEFRENRVKLSRLKERMKKTGR